LVSDERQGKCAVITGASSGIGAAFARKLAERGFDLVLVARRKERLDRLAAELATSRNVRADVFVADLADWQAVERLARHVADLPRLQLLVNNAGFGTMGCFVDGEVQPQLDMIRVHVLAAVRLARAVLPGMIERDGGGIINVSSIGAWLPVAGNAQYAATKTYLNTFSEAVADELRNTGVRVQALCPGFTYTEFHDVESMEGFDRGAIPKRLWMSADKVVDYSLRKLPGRRVIVIPGWRNRMLAFYMRTWWLKPIIRAVSRYKEER
jgi:short-subunit dehydrogenase